MCGFGDRARVWDHGAMTADDHRLARELAEEAGRRLVSLRTGDSDADTLRKAGDRSSHEFLTTELAAARPGDVVLSEEGMDDKSRLTADRVWIVDPLDGTREFGEAGRADWAVHVALWERAAGGLTAGAVALPAQGKVLSTVDAAGPVASPGASRQRLRIVVSRTRPAQLVRLLAGKLDADLIPCGSAGAKTATVLLGQADAYVHAGGFYEWDTAAPVAVAHAAGFHASRVDGAALTYNQADVLMPDILVCRPALAGALLEAIREVTHAS